MLHDEDSASIEDRAAACLVLLYAQPLSKIVSLTTDDLTLDDDGTYLRLGAEPLLLPPPLDALVTSLPIAKPFGAASTLADQRWLFPGKWAGHHQNPTSMMGRLKQAGHHHPDQPQLRHAPPRGHRPTRGVRQPHRHQHRGRHEVGRVRRQQLDHLRRHPHERDRQPTSEPVADVQQATAQRCGHLRMCLRLHAEICPGPNEQSPSERHDVLSFDQRPKAPPV